jgi:hypothetical protein
MDVGDGVAEYAGGGLYITGVFSENDTSLRRDERVEVGDVGRFSFEGGDA